MTVQVLQVLALLLALALISWGIVNTFRGLEVKLDRDDYGPFLVGCGVGSLISAVLVWILL